MFFTLPQRSRWLLLLVASYVFYMFWMPSYALLLFLSTSTVYLTALLMAGIHEKKKRKKYLWISVLVNLGLLFFFKYFNLFSDSVIGLFSILGLHLNSPTLSILLPVGISFYTFQALGYSFEVYHGRQKAEAHFGHFALFVSFFPQLVAGPIERSKNLLPQIKSLDAQFEYNRVSSGLKLILWGFFKKVVVADNLGILVNEIYDHPDLYGGLSFAIASILFGFQIYCDFAGYSDIAIGTARIMGVRLMLNFRTPFFSTSVSDFWKRWHISLSTWLRDYLFLPLAWTFSKKLKKDKYGLLKSNSIIYISAILLTFALTGLWHGAQWTFVLWGLIHALYLLLEFFTKKHRKKLLSFFGISKKSYGIKFLSILFTFSLVSFAWIFFRAGSVSEAFHIVSKIFSHWEYNIYPLLDKGFYVLGGLFSLLLLFIVELFMKNKPFEELFLNRPRFIRWSFYYLLLTLIIFMGYFGDVEFIYFQF
ncbi:MAG: MBOAT family protein [Bacteroidetes bacterium]|nr:MBOAT family protein [Bacteroidota bacterium]